MTIKKSSRNKILLESNQEDVKLELNVLDGNITCVLNSSGREIVINKPGDYEYGRVNVTAHEAISEGKYSATINLVKVLVEDVRTVFQFARSEISKDILNNIANLDILVTPFVTASKLKEDISDFDPKKLIIIKEFEGSVDTEGEDIKKALGVQNIEEGSYFKFKSTDFPNTEEFTLETYILK